MRQFFFLERGKSSPGPERTDITISHWTKIQTKLREKEYLKKALKHMGFTVEEGEFTITQYGTSSKAQLRIDNSVGLTLQEDGTYSMVGDFYHSRDSKLYKYYGRNEQFAQDLSSAYAIEQTKGHLEEQQFFCTENEAGNVGSDGLIRMVFERYA